MAGKNYDELAAGRDSPFRNKLTNVRNKTTASMPVPSLKPQVPNQDYLDRLTSAPQTSARATNIEEMERKVLFDETTDLNNYRTFVRTLNYELKRGERYKRPLAVATIVVDGLADFRVQAGNEVADYLLACAAHAIKAAIRDVDIAARYSDCGLVVLFPETNASGITTVAERMRQKIHSQQITYGADSYNITASIGGAAFPAHARKADELIARAAQASDLAAQRGGDRFCIM